MAHLRGVIPANAQFGGLLKKAKQKVENKVNETKNSAVPYDEPYRYAVAFICIFAVSYEATNTVYLLGKYLSIACC